MIFLALQPCLLVLILDLHVLIALSGLSDHQSQTTFKKKAACLAIYLCFNFIFTLFFYLIYFLKVPIPPKMKRRTAVLLLLFKNTDCTGTKKALRYCPTMTFVRQNNLHGYILKCAITPTNPILTTTKLFFLFFFAFVFSLFSFFSFFLFLQIL